MWFLVQCLDKGTLVMARVDLSHFERSAIKPLLPTYVCGVHRVDVRRVLNGIFWQLRLGCAVGGHSDALSAAHDVGQPGARPSTVREYWKLSQRPTQVTSR